MSFCVHCGTQLNPEARFCAACGKPIEASQPSLAGAAPSVPPPVSVVVPSVAVPAPTAVPAHTAGPAKTSHAVRNVVLLVIVIVVAAVAVSVLRGPQPEDSLDKARTAYLQHDAPAFHNYVDVQSILSDWTDQGLEMWVDQSHASGGDQLAAMGIAAGVKTLVVPKIASSVEQEILSGQLGSADAGDQNNFITNFLSSGVRAMVASQLTYQGIVAQSTCNPDWCLQVKVSTSASRSPLVVKIRMRRAGDHWQVSAIEDLPGLMQQLHQN